MSEITFHFPLNSFWTCRRIDTSLRFPWASIQVRRSSLTTWIDTSAPHGRFSNFSPFIEKLILRIIWARDFTVRLNRHRFPTRPHALCSTRTGIWLVGKRKSQFWYFGTLSIKNGIRLPGKWRSQFWYFGTLSIKTAIHLPRKWKSQFWSIYYSRC